MAGETAYNLSHPIELTFRAASGDDRVEKVAEVRVRRVTGADMLILDEPIGAQAKSQRVIAALTGLITKAGKSAHVTVAKDALAIQAAILGILGERFQGAMDRRSRTTAGKWSNLMDNITRSAVSVWQNGAGAAVGRGLDKMLAALGRATKDGSLERWTASVGSNLGALIDKMVGADWKGLGDDIASIASSLKEVADDARAAKNWIDQLHNRIVAPELQRRLLPNGILGAAADPVGTLRNYAAQTGRAFYDWQHPAPAPSRVLRHAPAVRTLYHPGSAAASAAPPMRGHITVEVKPSDGAGARVKSLRSDRNLQIDIKRGPVRTSG